MIFARTFLVALLSLGAGCSTQLYEGGVRPAADVSVVTLTRSDPNITFGNVIIDGRSVSSTQYGFTSDFHLLPAAHSIAFNYRIDADGYCDVREHLCPAVVVNGSCSGQFSTEGGQEYVVELVNRGATLGAVVRRARQLADLMASTGKPIAELACEKLGRGLGVEPQS